MNQDFIFRRKLYENHCNQIYNEIIEAINIYKHDPGCSDHNKLAYWQRDLKVSYSKDPILKLINEKNLKALKFIVYIRGPNIFLDKDIELAYNINWKEGYEYIYNIRYNHSESIDWTVEN